MSEQKQVPTYWAKIYIAGPIEVAKQVLRKCAAAKGMCVTIDPTTYIYSGGEETGYVVGLINYPRFPKKYVDDILVEAIVLADLLRAETGQKSYSIMTPNVTYYDSLKDET